MLSFWWTTSIEFCLKYSGPLNIVLAVSWISRLGWTRVTKKRSRKRKERKVGIIRLTFTTSPDMSTDFIDDCDLPNRSAMTSWREYSSAAERSADFAANAQALADRYRTAVGRASGCSSLTWNQLAELINSDRQVRWPSAQDWGLWRVKCRVGSTTRVL